MTHTFRRYRCKQHNMKTQSCIKSSYDVNGKIFIKQPACPVNDYQLELVLKDGDPCKIGMLVVTWTQEIILKDILNEYFIQMQ